MFTKKWTSKSFLLLIAIALGLGASNSVASDVDAALQGKLDKKFEEIAKWAGDPAIVAAVEAANAKPTIADMNQDKWKALGALDPAVVGLSKNDAAAAIKKLKGADVSEAFLNAKDGHKVALLAKTSSWKHDSSAKHKDPMAGKNWQGKVEEDESTRKKQIQLAVPVKSAKGEVIGSLVVGFDVNAMK